MTEICIADNRRLAVKRYEWDGVHVIETPDLLWGRGRSGWDLWDLLNRIGVLYRDRTVYDLVHCFETRPATVYPAIFYRRLHRAVPVITDWIDWWGRGGIIDQFSPNWYRWCFGRFETYYEEAFRARFDGLTVISSALCERAQDLGVPPAQIRKITGGTFPDLFQARSKMDACTHVGLPASRPILGFSSLDSFLDIEFILQVLAKVRKIYPDILLLITGKSGDWIRAIARQQRVEDVIHLTGFLELEELPWHLACADVFLLPYPKTNYNRGRWPNKLGDYISLGRPLVSNPTGEVRQVVEEHAIGLLAEWDVDQFAANVIRLLEDRELASQMGQRARALAETVYDWRVLVGHVEKFYLEIIRNKRSQLALGNLGNGSTCNDRV